MVPGAWGGTCAKARLETRINAHASKHERTAQAIMMRMLLPQM